MQNMDRKSHFSFLNEKQVPFVMQMGPKMSQQKNLLQIHAFCYADDGTVCVCVCVCLCVFVFVLCLLLCRRWDRKSPHAK